MNQKQKSLSKSDYGHFKLELGIQNELNLQYSPTSELMKSAFKEIQNTSD